MRECEEYPLVCKECESPEVYYENPITGCGKYACQDCGYVGERKDFNVILTRDELDSFTKAEQERDAVLAQVTVLARERDRQRSYCAVLWQEVKGKCEECSVFFGGDCQDDGTCNLRKVLDLTYEAAERVNALVGALERIEQSGTGTLDGVVVLTQEAKLARQALAEWRHEK